MGLPAPGAPVGMVMDGTAQWVFTILHFAIAIGVTAWVLRRWERDEARIALLILVGGGLSILAEPFFDRQGMIWHAEVGQWTAITMFGHSVPLWMAPVYYWFIGGQTIYVLRRLQAGATARQLWKLYVVFCVMDTLLELPILYAGGVYTYFGDQPLWDADVFPLPGWYIFTNGLLPLTGAAAVLLLQSLGDRRYLLLIPAAIPMSIFAVYAASAWPIWAALNADASTAVAYLAAAATIALALLSRQVLTVASVRVAAVAPTD
jgi:hypothetical protein